MIGARDWLFDPSPAANPNIVSTTDVFDLPDFDQVDRGVGVTLRFDKTTRPGDLRWIQVRGASNWLNVLRVKTGLGALLYDQPVECTLRVIDADGAASQETIDRPSYLWPHEIQTRHVNLPDLIAKQSDLFAKRGPKFQMPGSFKNIEALHQNISGIELDDFVSLTGSERDFIESYGVWVYFCYFYTETVFPRFNEEIGVRKGQLVLSPGIQLAANNMPQGEVIQIPLTRNIGRQNQTHMIFHFANARPDMGRKGFQREFVEFCESVSGKLIQSYISKYTSYLCATSGATASLARQQKVDDWKKEFEAHEIEAPLVVNNPLFFKPKSSVSVLSVPTREQDVIALFNQFLAGRVIRGIDILSTNERFAYDSMFRIINGNDSEKEIYVYDETNNPLGVDSENFIPEFRSHPKILEYKYSLDALIEDVSRDEKNTNEIDLVVVWESGTDFEGNFHITSLIDPDNISERGYHGLTHKMTNVTTGQHELDLIVLSELISFLNDKDAEIAHQREKYED